MYNDVRFALEDDFADRMLWNADRLAMIAYPVLLHFAQSTHLQVMSRFGSLIPCYFPACYCSHVPSISRCRALYPAKSLILFKRRAATVAEVNQCVEQA